MKTSIKILLILCGSLLTAAIADAQIIEPPPAASTSPMPYPFLRQDDMLWSKRHWERIDIKQKINLPLYYPVQALPDRKSMFDVIKDAILQESTISEVFMDDMFEIALTKKEIEKRISSYDTLRDPDDPTKILYIDTIEIKSAHVVAWDLKSDWYFDKQRGEMKNRIIGISPRVRNPNNKSEIYNLFWVWYPDARIALAANFAYNVNNRSKPQNFDLILTSRRFNSVIIKEDNVYARAIKDYKRNSAMDQLLEARYIRENLRNLEHDMWEF